MQIESAGRSAARDLAAATITMQDSSTCAIRDRPLRPADRNGEAPIRHDRIDVSVAGEVPGDRLGNLDAGVGGKPAVAFEVQVDPLSVPPSRCGLRVERSLCEFDQSVGVGRGPEGAIIAAVMATAGELGVARFVEGRLEQ